MGLTAATVADLTFYLDYYFVAADGNQWGRFETKDPDGKYGDFYFNFSAELTTKNAWAKAVISRDGQKLGDGDDLSIQPQNYSSTSSLYIRGIKVVAKISDSDTRTAVWGTYAFTKEKLQAVIDQYDATSLKTKYTAASVDAFMATTAIADAQAVANTDSLTMLAYSNAFHALEAVAQEYLVPLIAISGNVATTIDYKQYDASASSTDGSWLGGSGIEGIGAGKYFGYPVYVEKTGYYKVDMQLATANSDSYTVILRDKTDNTLGSVSVSNTGGWGTYQTFTMRKVLLSAGAQTLCVYFDNGGVNYGGMTLTPVNQVSAIVALPDPTIHNTGNTSIVENDPDQGGKTYLKWTSTGNVQWNQGVIANALGLSSDTLVDLDITFDYYRGTDNANNGNWWHFNTNDKNGESAPGLSNGILHDGGFGSLYEYGLTTTGSWGTATISRTEQTFGKNGADVNINVGGLTGTFYLSNIRIVATTKDGLKVTGVWGGSTGSVGTLDGYSLTLSGDVGINFIMSDVPENASMTFVLPNGETEKAAYVAGENNTYKFTCHVAAKEMADTVIAQLTANGMTSDIYTYSVAEYANAILSDSAYAEAQPLVKAMLDYGAYAQKYFGYNETNLANGGTDNNDVKNVTAEDLSPYTKTPKAGGVTFYGASLDLLSNTTLRLYFKKDADATGTVKLNDVEQTLEFDSANNLYYMDITDIPAHQLNTATNVTLSDGTTTEQIDYTVMSYCKNVLSRSSTPDALKNVMRALYLYYTAAVAYTTPAV